MQQKIKDKKSTLRAFGFRILLFLKPRFSPIICRVWMFSNSLDAISQFLSSSSWVSITYSQNSFKSETEEHVRICVYVLCVCWMPNISKACYILGMSSVLGTGDATMTKTRSQLSRIYYSGGQRQMRRKGYQYHQYYAGDNDNKRYG